MTDYDDPLEGKIIKCPICGETYCLGDGEHICEYGENNLKDTEVDPDE